MNQVGIFQGVYLELEKAKQSFSLLDIHFDVFQRNEEQEENGAMLM